MATLRALLWLAVGAAVVAGGWLLMEPRISPPDWSAIASNPSVIGTPTDHFAYTGGEAIVSVDGSANLQIGPDDRGTLHVAVGSSGVDLPFVLRDGSPPGRALDLVSVAGKSTKTWISQPIHGDSGTGDARLPRTIAQIAGQSMFDVVIDGDRQWVGLTGVWSIADALRQADGSIRQQGLIFSPLLRDKTGFSDPTRLELTLLLYEDGPGSEVLLHLVFESVELVRSPGAT